MTEPVLPCFGISPKTGRRVRRRHRWPKYRAGGGKWGEGRCLYCGKRVEDLTPTGQRLERETGELFASQENT